MSAKLTFKRLLLVGVSLFVCLSAIELILRTGFFDGIDDAQPIWIPPYLKAQSDAIDAVNELRASHHPFGFNDSVRGPRKTSKSRIVILGDSFIWGSGLKYDEIWNHRLEKSIAAKYGNDIEVVSWGQRGWATVDEFAFLKDHINDFDIDFLIVDFVSNDPDVYMTTLKTLDWQKSPILSPVRWLFPNTLSFSSAYINNVLQMYFLTDYGYVNWEQSLYCEAGLREYARLLKTFSRFCDEHGVKLLFVLTPNNLDPVYRYDIAKVTPLLREASISYLDLYPVVRERLAGVPPRKLWANPADGHPGALMTEVFASEVNTYLESHGILARLANAPESAGARIDTPVL